MFLWNYFAIFNDPTDVGNLISDSSAFSKSSLYVWNFFHILLKPSLKDFEHYPASLWNEHDCIVEHPLALRSFGIGMKTDLFPSCGHCWVFQICWHIECSTLAAASLRIFSSSAGIPSSPLAFSVVMLPKAHSASYSSMSGSRRVTTPSWLSGSLRPYLYGSVYFATSSWHILLLLGPYHF